MFGWKNHYIKSGHVGYITKDPIFGKASYIGTLTGPASTGMVYLQYVKEIDVRSYGFIKKCSALTKDNIKIEHLAFIFNANLNPNEVEHIQRNYAFDNSSKLLDDLMSFRIRSLFEECIGTLNALDVWQNKQAIIDFVVNEYNKDSVSKYFQLTHFTMDDPILPDCIAKQFVNAEQQKATLIAAETENKVEILKAQAFAEKIKLIQGILPDEVVEILKIEMLKSLKELKLIDVNLTIK